MVTLHGGYVCRTQTPSGRVGLRSSIGASTRPVGVPRDTRSTPPYQGTRGTFSTRTSRKYLLFSSLHVSTSLTDSGVTTLLSSGPRILTGSEVEGPDGPLKGPVRTLVRHRRGPYTTKKRESTPSSASRRPTNPFSTVGTGFIHRKNTRLRVRRRPPLPRPTRSATRGRGGRDAAPTLPEGPRVPAPLLVVSDPQVRRNTTPQVVLRGPTPGRRRVRHLPIGPVHSWDPVPPRRATRVVGT